MKCLYCQKPFKVTRKDKVYCSDSCRATDNNRKKRQAKRSQLTSFFNDNKVILSLCDYSGNWSQPYREAGYTVE